MQWIVQRALDLWDAVVSRVQHPLRQCALLTIFIFLLFVAEGVAAVLVHTQYMLYATAAFHGICLTNLLAYCLWLLRLKRRTKWSYDANLTNTILTCLVTMFMCSLLYPFVWYSALNREVLTQAVEDLDTVRLPAVAFVSTKQSKDRYRVAELFDNPPPKAFLSDATAGFENGLPQCAAQTQDEILATHYCDCSEMFSRVLDQPPPAYIEGFSYQSFVPIADMQVNSTNTSLALQIFPRHNSTDIADGWPNPGPMLQIMLHDPDLPFTEAYEDGLTSIIQIPMLATTAVMVSPTFRVGWKRKPYYYYKTTTTSVPYLNDICDQKTSPGKWCYTSVNIQFTDLTRTIHTRKAASIGWVFAQVGGFFAIVQLLSWMISGMAIRSDHVETSLPIRYPRFRTPGAKKPGGMTIRLDHRTVSSLNKLARAQTRE